MEGHISFGSRMLCMVKGEGAFLPQGCQSLRGNSIEVQFLVCTRQPKLSLCNDFDIRLIKECVE